MIYTRHTRAQLLANLKAYNVLGVSRYPIKQLRAIYSKTVYKHRPYLSHPLINRYAKPAPATIEPTTHTARTTTTYR